MTLRLDPPKIISAFDSELNLLEGSDESIVCQVMGTPNLRVYWKIDEAIIQSDVLEYNSIMRIGKAFTGKANFTCIVENRFGRDARTVSVKIVGKVK